MRPCNRLYKDLRSRSSDTRFLTFLSSPQSSMVLKLKDVQAVEPHPLHINKDSPLPFIECFTCEDILSFWDGERRAFQWVYVSEKNSRQFYLHSSNLDVPLPNFDRAPGEHAYGPGPKRQYDWSLKHQFRRWEKEQNIILKRGSDARHIFE